MTRNFAKRFNHRYNVEYFPEPQAFNFGDSLIKVPSLDGSGKMSKSENENATIYLQDSDDLIRKKVMKAKTDQGPTEPNTPMPDYIENLFAFMKLVCAADIIEKYQQDYQNCTIRYGDAKKQLAEDMVAFIAPIREKATLLQEDTALLQKIMKQGADKARANAEKNIQEIRALMGIQYY
jgi:tryptophanyl-tRNA synthetase